MAEEKLKTKSLKLKTEPKKVKVQTKSSLVNKTLKVSSPVKKGLTVDVFDTKGKVSGKIELPNEVFGAKINKSLIAQAVRVYLANQRTGSSSTKTRGEVKGSTRKIYRQKGTGRARHGGIRAPIFVGGGIAFGPKPRDFSLKLPQKMRRAALFSALSSKLSENEIKIVEGLEKLAPKTKLMANLLKNIQLNDKKILLVVPSKKESFSNLEKAARNIEGINIIEAQTLNTYEVLDNSEILFAKDALENIKKTFLS